MSLSEVATQASISTATLSRIETGKQNIEVGLLIILAGILHLSPHELFEDEGIADAEGDVAEKIAVLKPNDRARFWKDLAGSRKRLNAHSKRVGDLTLELEELLAQIDFLRAEVERIRTSVRTRRVPRAAVVVRPR